MPIFHFDVYDGVALPDEDGHELPGIEEAKRQAVLYAAELIRELSDKFWNGEEWTMNVTDENRMTLFTLIFIGIKAPCVTGATVDA